MGSNSSDYYDDDDYTNPEDEQGNGNEDNGEDAYGDERQGEDGYEEESSDKDGQDEVESDDDLQAPDAPGAAALDFCELYDRSSRQGHGRP